MNATTDIDPQLVKQLREKTNAGFMDCKRALVESGGDLTKVKGKPEQVAEKIVEGKLEKFYSTVCLLEQAFIKNPDVTIKDLLSAKIAELGENIVIRRFVRYLVGEPLPSET